MAGPHQPFGLPDPDLPHQKYMYVCMYVLRDCDRVSHYRIQYNQFRVVLDAVDSLNVKHDLRLKK